MPNSWFGLHGLTPQKFGVNFGAAFGNFVQISRLFSETSFSRRAVLTHGPRSYYVNNS